MALNVEYRPVARELRLQPAGDDEWPAMFSVLDAEIVLGLPRDPDEQQRYVADRAGELGLLDATRVDLAEGSVVSLGEFMRVQWADYPLGDIAEYHGQPVQSLVAVIDEDRYLRSYMLMVGISGRGVPPDLVPDAATLGIAAWCWRNDTAVEAWHVSGDVLMARVNIAVTKAIAEHVDPDEGVDWAGRRTVAHGRSLVVARRQKNRRAVR